jgi:hypothetical protein
VALVFALSRVVGALSALSFVPLVFALGSCGRLSALVVLVCRSRSFSWLVFVCRSWSALSLVWISLGSFVPLVWISLGSLVWLSFVWSALSRVPLVWLVLVALSFVVGSCRSRSLSRSRGAALVAQQRVPLVARGSCGSRSCSLALVALMPLSFVVGAHGALSLSCGSWCRSRAARGSLVRVALSRSFSWLIALSCGAHPAALVPLSARSRSPQKLEREPTVLVGSRSRLVQSLNIAFSSAVIAR